MEHNLRVHFIEKISEPFRVEQVRAASRPAGSHNLIAFRNKVIYKMAADKTGCTGY